MFSPPVVEIAAPRDDVEISKVASPTVEFYRRLYHEVDSTFHWVDRLVMQDEKLLAIIHHDLVDVLVLTAADEPLGYAELDRRQAGEIELAYFGLFPSATGQGLGNTCSTVRCKRPGRTGRNEFRFTPATWTTWLLSPII
jgi:hypothetical protein